MSNQIVITSGAKVRNLDGVLTGTSGIVGSVGFGTANGVATLDSSGKVPLSQLPASVITYLGTWNASTNTPTLTNGVGDVGDLYICNVAGTVNFGAGPITFAVGDWVIYSGTTWEKSGGASGTVTSVAMTVPTGLSVTGSPITTSGTLAVSLASGYTIPTTSFLQGLVPYTGATGNVNLGEYGLSGGYIGLDTTPTSTPTSVGTLSWDTTYLTPKVVTGTGATTIQIGQEEVILVHNNTGSTLVDGQVVYVTGSTGELPSVSLADASSETTSAATLGVVTETIANGSNGFITVSGIVHGLNTLAYNEGDLLWLSETAGEFTNVKPISPAHLVLIGYVIKKAGGNGSILVKIQNTQELAECSDVLFTSLANNDILAYESSTDLWKNKTIANVLGYTPANAATYVPYTGATTTLNLGAYQLFGGSLNVMGDGSTYGGVLNFKQYSSISGGGLDYTTIFAQQKHRMWFDFNQSAGVSKSFVIDVSGLTNSTPRQYYMPNADGTIALTSDIPSLANYVTLTGAQTITGIKTFTNEQLFGNGITLTGGYITYTSGAYNLTLNTNILTANRNVFLQDGSGTLAFTSDIPSLSGYVQGSGTTNYHAKFTGTSTIGNSMLTDDGTTLQSIGATRSNLYLKAASSAYYSQLAFTNGSNGSFGGISYNNSGQYMQFETNSSEWARLNSDGKFLINGTSASNYYRLQVFQGAAEAGILIKATNSGRYAPLAIVDHTNTTKFSIDETSTAYFAGNVGIGTSSPSAKMDIVGDIRIRRTADTTQYMDIFPSGGYGYIDAINSASATNQTLVFRRANNIGYTESMRITDGGYLKASNNGSYNYPTNPFHSIENTAADNACVFVSKSASVPYGISVIYSAAAPNNSGSQFYYASDSSQTRFYVNANGGIGNYQSNNQNLSDIRTKKDITPLESYWDKFKAIEIVKFKYKDQTHDDFNIGVIAQQVEEVAPEFVDIDGFGMDSIPEDGVPLKTIYTADLYHATIKVLKEAMAKIEQLEAKVTALENK